MDPSTSSGAVPQPRVEWDTNIQSNKADKDGFRGLDASGKLIASTTFTITNENGVTSTYSLTYETRAINITDDEIRQKFEEQIQKIALLSARYLSESTRSIVYNPNTGEVTKHDDKGHTKKSSHEYKTMEDIVKTLEESKTKQMTKLATSKDQAQIRKFENRNQRIALATALYSTRNFTARSTPQPQQQAATGSFRVGPAQQKAPPTEAQKCEALGRELFALYGEDHSKALGHLAGLKNPNVDLVMAHYFHARAHKGAQTPSLTTPSDDGRWLLKTFGSDRGAVFQEIRGDPLRMADYLLALHQKEQQKARPLPIAPTKADPAAAPAAAAAPKEAPKPDNTAPKITIEIDEQNLVIDGSTLTSEEVDQLLEDVQREHPEIEQGAPRSSTPPQRDLLDTLLDELEAKPTTPQQPEQPVVPSKAEVKSPSAPLRPPPSLKTPPSVPSPAVGQQLPPDPDVRLNAPIPKATPPSPPSVPSREGRPKLPVRDSGGNLKPTRSDINKMKEQLKQEEEEQKIKEKLNEVNDEMLTADLEVLDILSTSATLTPPRSLETPKSVSPPLGQPLPPDPNVRLKTPELETAKSQETEKTAAETKEKASQDLPVLDLNKAREFMNQEDMPIGSWIVFIDPESVNESNAGIKLLLKTATSVNTSSVKSVKILEKLMEQSKKYDPQKKQSLEKIVMSTQGPSAKSTGRVKATASVADEKPIRLVTAAFNEFVETDKKFTQDTNDLVNVFNKLSEKHPEDQALNEMLPKLRESADILNSFSKIEETFENWEELLTYINSEEGTKYLEAFMSMQELTPTMNAALTNYKKELAADPEAYLGRANAPLPDPIKFVQRAGKLPLFLRDLEKNNEKISSDAAKIDENLIKKAYEKVEENYTKMNAKQIIYNEAADKIKSQLPQGEVEIRKKLDEYIETLNKLPPYRKLEAADNMIPLMQTEELSEKFQPSAGRFEGSNIEKKTYLRPIKELVSNELESRYEILNDAKVKPLQGKMIDVKNAKQFLKRPSVKYVLGRESADMESVDKVRTAIKDREREIIDDMNSVIVKVIQKLNSAKSQSKEEKQKAVLEARTFLETKETKTYLNDIAAKEAATATKELFENLIAELEKE